MATDFDPSKVHPLYSKWVPKWDRQRDLLEGEDRVKERGTKYLPALSGQTSQMNGGQVISTYEAYKDRASFLNATGRTRDGLVGAIMRKDPDVEWPEARAEELDFVGFGQESLSELIDETLDEVVGVGRFGQLVDMPEEEGGLPFVSKYAAEAITDWEVGVVLNKLARGRKHTVRVNLREHSGMFNADKEELQKYRVLRLGVPSPVTEEESKMSMEEFLGQWGLVPGDFEDGPVYFQELWLEADSSKDRGKDFIREAVIVPRMVGGVLWREIPFTFFNAANIRPKPEKPSLLDLAVINVSHYRNSADMEHGMHFTALPQPWVAGFTFTGDLQIGSGVAWVSEDPQAKAGYLEFTGAGLNTIKVQMEEKEQRMASLGARLLESNSPSGGAEAAETVKLRQSGERSALARTSIAVSSGMTRTLRFLSLFLGRTEEVSVRLNLDFGVDGLAPAMLRELMGQVISGLMSWDTYVFNLRRGELYPDKWTQEEEAAAIIAGAPGDTLSSLMDPQDSAPPEEEESPKNEGGLEDGEGDE